MIGTTRSLRVFAYPAPCDLRKGFDTLHALVRESMCRSIETGDAFLFVNRRRDRAKVLYWDGTGMCLFSKRLESGRFPKLWGRSEGYSPRGIELTFSELSLFLEGCRAVEIEELAPPEFEIVDPAA